jgi:hypothetical protein
VFARPRVSPVDRKQHDRHPFLFFARQRVRPRLRALLAFLGLSL